MGQYYIMANVDKKEYVDPMTLRDGVKLLEVMYGGGVGKAFVLLCSHNSCRGGGDIRDGARSKELQGRWYGDRVMMVGDYAEDSDWADSPDGVELGTLYSKASCGDGWTDISHKVSAAIQEQDALC